MPPPSMAPPPQMFTLAPTPAPAPVQQQQQAPRPPVSQKQVVSPEYDDSICGICWERSVNTQLVPCNHKVCKHCILTLHRSAEILKMKQEACPFCRNPITGYTFLENGPAKGNAVMQPMDTVTAIREAVAAGEIALSEAQYQTGDGFRLVRPAASASAVRREKPAPLGADGAPPSVAEHMQLAKKNAEKVRKEAAEAGNKEKDKNHLFKTRICARWENNSCNMGKMCVFAHGSDEIVDKKKGNKGSSASQNNKHGTEELQKTRICVYIEEGKKCWAGSKCTFAHTKDELKPNPYRY